MKLITSVGIVMALTITMGAAQDSGQDVPEPPLITEADALDEFLWVARPVVVFADTPNDPRFVQQIALLEQRKAELLDRDVIVITDTDPAGRSELRRQLRPRGFMLALVGKDGRVALRKPAPWDVRELTRVIDKMPLRQQEIRDGLRGQG